MRRGVNAAICVLAVFTVALDTANGHSRRHLAQLGKPQINGKIVSVPAGFSECSVKVDLPEPLVDCTEPETPEDAVFNTKTDVDLGLGELQSCKIQARFPPKKKPLVSCLAIPPIIIEDYVLDGRMLTVPYGAVRCVATKLQKGEKPSVTCDSPGPGSTQEYFTKGVTVEIPQGRYQRCVITPQNATAEIDCQKLAKVNIDQPVVDGRDVIVPSGAAMCSAKNMNGDKMDVFCEPPMSGKEDPTFLEDVKVTMPGVAFESCEILPGEIGQAKVNCHEVSYVGIGDPLVKENKIFIPEGAALCMATSFKGGNPIVVCVPAPFGAGIPSFEDESSYELPTGDFGRCVFTPEKGRECDAITSAFLTSETDVNAEAPQTEPESNPETESETESETEPELEEEEEVAMVAVAVAESVAQAPSASLPDSVPMNEDLEAMSEGSQNDDEEEGEAPEMETVGEEEDDDASQK